MFQEINQFLNDLIWGHILLYLLPLIGIFFTISSRFVQFRYFFKMFGVLKWADKDKDGHIGPFKALMLGVGGRVGVGNIGGVAIAITLGGPGSIFWMWIIGLIGMSTSFFECSLAQLYKEKDHLDSNIYRGGPAYYVSKGLRQKWLAIVISILSIITFGFAFNAMESFVITTSLHSSFNIPVAIVGLIITVFYAIILFGGIKKISQITDFLVPIMALIYIAITIIIIALNISEIPSLISTIMHEAFHPNSVIGGGIGTVILQGAKRGLFSNEAGLGSAPNIAAVVYVKHPVHQGIIQSFSVFIDTIVLCSCTAFIILLSDVYVPGAKGVEGVLLTQNAVIHIIGSVGGYFVTIALFLFGFSSMLYYYYISESNLYFFSKDSKLAFTIIRITCVGLALWGTQTDLSSILEFADTSMGVIAVFNMVIIVLLYKPVLRLIKEYDRQKKEGREEPVLNYNDYEEFNVDKDWKEITSMLK